MAPNPNANLLIGVGLDLAQMRADKITLEREIRDLNRTAGLQAAKGDTAGLAATAGNLIAHEAQLAAVTRRYNEATKGAQGLRDTLREIADHGERLRSVFEMGGGFATGGGVGALGGLMRGILAGGPLAMAGAGAAAVVGGGAFAAHEAGQYAREVNASAAALGLTTGQMDEWIVAAKKGNVEQEVAIRAWERFSIAAEKAADNQRKLTFEINKSLASTGALDSVARGTRGHARSNAHLIDGTILQSLLNNPGVAQEAARQLNQLKDVNLDRVNQRQAPFPLPDLRTLISQIANAAAEDTPEGAKLRAQYRATGATGIGTANLAEGIAAREAHEKLDTLTGMKIATTDLLNQSKKTGEVYQQYLVEFRKLNEGAANLAQRTLMGRGGINPELQQFQREQGENIENGGTGGIASTAGPSEAIAAGLRLAEAERSAVVTAWRAVIDVGLREAEVGGQVVDKFREIVGAAGAVAQKLAAPLSSAGESLAAGMASGGGGMAEGGVISGPGTGTSDSIIARVSNGEFVVNAMATSRNLSLLHAINSGFADGGLVGFPSLPRFAEGGHVGNTPVHLHLNGREYQMHATENVAGALVAEQQSQQAKSAGTKPTWFGR